MTDQANKQQVSASFESRMEILTQELGLSIRWHRPCVAMIAYGSVYVRDDAVSLLENFLIDLDRKVVWISAGDSVVNSLEFWHKILQDTEKVVFFIDGFADLAYQRKLMNILNHHAYLFLEKKARLVLWLTHNEASMVAYQAPGLWEYRNCLIELAVSPKPEQILQTALESAWQGTGEYTDQFEDTEEKISLRETFLSGLPENTESTSIRANLMLTLGILHWRKGDFEKAGEMLQNALKIAAALQDNLFEAKCFNAIALIKSSLGKNEEAIDSYKQAIALAPDQIFAWNNLGNLCLKIDRGHEAMIAFQKAIEHNSADPVAWNGMGDVYSRSGYVDDAIAAYRKSIDLAPTLPHPWNGLGEVYAHSGRLDDAVVAYQKAIKLNIHFIQPWLGLAKLYEKQERYRDASRAYQQALMIDPQNSVIWNDLGCIHLAAKQYEDAVEVLTRAVELDRKYGWAYSNLGLAYALRENFAQSIILYQKSLELLQDRTQVGITWNRLANAHRMLNDYENAIKAYQMADSLNIGVNYDFGIASSAPEVDSASKEESESDVEPAPSEERSEDVSVEQAVDDEESEVEETPFWLFHSIGEADDTSIKYQVTDSEFGATKIQSQTTTQEIGGDSMQIILPFMTNKRISKPKKLTAAETGNARMWNEKGNVLLRAGKFEEAVQAYNKAVKYDRSFGWSYTNLGIAYLQMGRYAEAALLFQKSLDLLKTDSDRAVAWNGLGNLYRCLNDYHNAVAAYQKADELDPDNNGSRDTVEYMHSEATDRNAKVWNELGDTFFEAGSYSEASNCYRKATEMFPQSGWAFSNLALSLTHETKLEESIPYFLKCIDLFEDDKDKADAWNRLGNVYRRLNDYDNAIAAYQNAVKLNHETATIVTRTRFSLLGNCTVD
jgi:tetratricopeptide (TPR) repeat protein